MFSDKIVQNLTRASFIRSMFEEGEKLKAKVGAENVFDFSLGNPVIEPPRSVKETLKRLASEEETGMFRYMSNAGYWQARKAVADSLSKESKKDIPPSHVIMTCGAGGALNVLFKSLLNPGEEVIVFSPYFVEYGFYVDNHGGKLTVCDTIHDTFMPDLAKLEKLINEKTKVVMYNSPNNPTGVIYKEDMLKGMNDVITGIKLYNQYFISDPVVRPVIEKCIELDIPILSHAGKLNTVPNPQPTISDGTHFAEAARNYPEAVFVYGHIGGGGDWQWSLKAIADYPNVYADISGSVYDEGIIEQAVSYLGAGRLLFATDGSFSQGIGKLLGANISQEDKITILNNPAFARYLERGL